MPGTARLWQRPLAQWQAPAAQRSNQAQRTLAMTTFGSRADGLRLERMRASPRWAGDGFRNRHPITPGLRDSALAMPSTVDFLCAGQRRVASGRLPVAHPLVAWRLPPETGLRATWLGQSTVLVELDGLRVLTDPVWGASCITLAPGRPQAVSARAGGLECAAGWRGVFAGVLGHCQPGAACRGEPVQPARVAAVLPWWRAVDSAAPAPRSAAAPAPAMTPP